MRNVDIGGVGNLLVMTVTEAEENQLSSFVIMPYSKNLPLFSTDYVYSGDRLTDMQDIPALSGDALEEKWKINKAYADRLLQTVKAQPAPGRRKLAAGLSV